MTPIFHGLQSGFRQIDCWNPSRFCVFHETTGNEPNMWVKILILQHRIESRLSVVVILRNQLSQVGKSLRT